MRASTDTTEVEAEAEADFAISVARTKSLSQAIEIYGHRFVFLLWRMGWCTGKSAGLAEARRLFTE